MDYIPKELLPIKGFDPTVRASPELQKMLKDPDPWHTSVDVDQTSYSATWWGGNHTEGIYHSADFNMEDLKETLWQKYSISSIRKLRVQRVQDISSVDCERCGVIKEACYWHPYHPHFNPHPDFYRYAFGKKTFDLFKTPQEAFKTFWINKHGEKSWNENEWIWIVDFYLVGDGVLEPIK